MMRRALGIVVLWVALLSGAAQHAAAAAPAADPSWTADEAWAWSQIARGRTADFTPNCARPPEPLEEDAGWTRPCRTLRSAMLAQVLTQDPWRGALRHEGVQVNAARIVGDLDLSNAHVGAPVVLTHSRVDGGIMLMRSHLDSLFAVDASVVTGVIEAAGLVSASDISLSDGRQLLPPLAVARGSYVDGGVDLRRARIAGSLFLNASKFARTIDLRGTHIDADLQASGATFASGLLGGSLQIGGDLAINSICYASQLLLPNMTVRGLVDASRSRIAKLSMVDGHVGGDAFLTLLDRPVAMGDAAGWPPCGQAIMAPVANPPSSQLNLSGLTIQGYLQLSGTRLSGPLAASGAKIAGDLLLDDTVIAGPIDLQDAQIGGRLDLATTTLEQLDLTGATIGGALQVGRATTWTGALTPGAPALVLVNATIKALQDGEVAIDVPCPGHGTPSASNGWPPGGGMEIEGLTYTRLGALGGSAGANMRMRKACWWRQWIERDPHFSTQPYMQLASVMSAHGDQEDAATIQYYGRLRETRHAWQSGQYGRFLLLASLYVIAGFGIGTRSFWVLVWVVLLTAIGIALLRYAPGSREKSWPWRIGASLTRVLPGIELNKEFSDFFDDPKRTRLKGWQLGVFSVIVLFGWVLGIFLVAAMTGLTQHP